MLNLLKAIYKTYPPNRNLAWITSKCSNVLTNPVESKTLVTKTKVSVTATENLVGEQESPSTEPVVDTDSNKWSINLNTVLYDETEVVATVDTTTLKSSVSLWEI